MSGLTPQEYRNFILDMIVNIHFDECGDEEREARTAKVGEDLDAIMATLKDETDPKVVVRALGSYEYNDDAFWEQRIQKRGKEDRNEYIGTVEQVMADNKGSKNFMIMPPEAEVRDFSRSYGTSKSRSTKSIEYVVDSSSEEETQPGPSSKPPKPQLGTASKASKPQPGPASKASKRKKNATPDLESSDEESSDEDSSDEDDKQAQKKAARATKPANPAAKPAVPADPPAVPADPPAVPADPPAVPADPPAVPADPPAVPADPPAASVDPPAALQVAAAVVAPADPPTALQVADPPTAPGSPVFGPTTPLCSPHSSRNASPLKGSSFSLSGLPASVQHSPAGSQLRLADNGAIFAPGHVEFDFSTMRIKDITYYESDYTTEIKYSEILLDEEKDHMQDWFIHADQIDPVCKLYEERKSEYDKVHQQYQRIMFDKDYHPSRTDIESCLNAFIDASLKFRGIVLIICNFCKMWDSYLVERPAMFHQYNPVLYISHNMYYGYYNDLSIEFDMVFTALTKLLEDLVETEPPEPPAQPAPSAVRVTRSSGAASKPVPKPVADPKPVPKPVADPKPIAAEIPMQLYRYQQMKNFRAVRMEKSSGPAGLPGRTFTSLKVLIDKLKHSTEARDQHEAGQRGIFNAFIKHLRLWNHPNEIVRDKDSVQEAERKRAPPVLLPTNQDLKHLSELRFGWCDGPDRQWIFIYQCISFYCRRHSMNSPFEVTLENNNTLSFKFYDNEEEYLYQCLPKLLARVLWSELQKKVMPEKTVKGTRYPDIALVRFCPLFAIAGCPDIIDTTVLIVRDVMFAVMDILFSNDLLTYDIYRAPVHVFLGKFQQGSFSGQNQCYTSYGHVLDNRCIIQWTDHKEDFDGIKLQKKVPNGDKDPLSTGRLTNPNCDKVIGLLKECFLANVSSPRLARKREFCDKFQLKIPDVKAYKAPEMFVATTSTPIVTRNTNVVKADKAPVMSAAARPTTAGKSIPRALAVITAAPNDYAGFKDDDPDSESDSDSSGSEEADYSGSEEEISAVPYDATAEAAAKLAQAAAKLAQAQLAQAPTAPAPGAKRVRKASTEEIQAAATRAAATRAAAAKRSKK